jgi:hypothetical protein
MYSPRIREALIPRIYQVARETGVAMTTWVNQVIEAALAIPRQRGGDEAPINPDTGTLEPDRPTRKGGQSP